MSADLQGEVESMKKAMKNWKRNNMALIKIIANQSAETRQKVKMVYKSTYGSDLIEDLKSETGKKFNDTVDALYLSPAEYDCVNINKALTSDPKNLDLILEILTNRTNEQIKNIRDKYTQMYDVNLKAEMYNHIRGDERYMIANLIAGRRSESVQPNDSEMEIGAKQIHEFCEGQVCCSEPPFIDLLTLHSGAELTQIARHYYKLYGKTIIQAMRIMYEGESGDLYQKLFCDAINPPEYFCNQIKEALKTKETAESDLIRIILSRADIDLPRIKKFYKKLFNVEITEDIESATSGSNQNLLVELCNREK